MNLTLRMADDDIVNRIPEGIFKDPEKENTRRNLDRTKKTNKRENCDGNKSFSVFNRVNRVIVLKPQILHVYKWVTITNAL